MTSAPQVQKVSCASCGAAIAIPADIDRINCAYCGSQLLVRRGEGYIATKLMEQLHADLGEVGKKLDDIRGALGANEDEVTRCPRCKRSDRASYIEAVVQAETVTAQVDGDEQTSQTELARALAFPEFDFVPTPMSQREVTKREVTKLQVGIRVGIVVIGGIIALAGSPGGALLVVIALFAVTELANARNRRQEEEAEYLDRQLAGYEVALKDRREAYANTCYCARCHVIFMYPGQDTYPVSDLGWLLDVFTPGSQVQSS